VNLRLSENRRTKNLRVARLLLAVMLAATLITGCGQHTEDLDDFITQVENTPPSAIEPYPEFTTQPTFKYSAETFRSPFQRLQTSEQTLPLPKVANCRQPNVKRAKMTLEQYGIDALSIQGFFTTSQTTYAIIVANDGSLHKIAPGDRLGLFYGRVTAIRQNTIFYTELVPDGTGCWKEKQSKLTITKDNGENNNV